MNGMLNKPVLITGGAGYIGSHVILALIDNGHSVVVIDDLSTGRRSAVPDSVPFYEGKVEDIDLIHRIISEHGCHSVMHFAGSIIVPDSIERPIDYYLNNVAASAYFLRACKSNGIESFVFSSTAGVYKGAPGLGQTLPEDTNLEPANPYGRSKLMTEWMLQDVAAVTNMRFAVLRYFNVAGADHNGRSGQSSKVPTHLMKRACQTVLGILPYIEIFGDDYLTTDGTCIRDYIHISDLANAHVAVLDHITTTRESLTINCGYGQGYSVSEVLDAVDQVAAKMLRASPMQRRLKPRRMGDPPILIADTSLIMEILNWQPKFNDLSVMAATALAWEKKLLEEDF